MEDKISKKSEINISVGLNENNLPLAMHWTASDGGIEKAPASAFILSIWDPTEKNTLKIDLWTKDITVDEMKQFFHQSLSHHTSSSSSSHHTLIIPSLFLKYLYLYLCLYRIFNETTTTKDRYK